MVTTTTKKHQQQQQQQQPQRLNNYMQPLKRSSKIDFNEQQQQQNQAVGDGVVGDGASDANSVLRSISAIQTKHPNLKIDLKHQQKVQLQHNNHSATQSQQMSA